MPRRPSGGSNEVQVYIMAGLIAAGVLLAIVYFLLMHTTPGEAG